ncbi:MAG: hypothetical protein GHCLOJNM_04046 [bacterium]|nr:hypothetical protein [bacterium]
MSLKAMRAFFALSVVVFLILGCSTDPQVEKEVVAPPSRPAVTNPHGGDAGMVGSSHQQEAELEKKEGAPAQSAAAETGESPVRPKEGYRVAKGTDRGGSGTIHFRIPENWSETKPATMMRALQVSIPPASGDEQAGEIAFFASIGGSAQDNLDRWIGQFSQPDGSDSKAKAKIEDLEGEHHKFKLLDLSGTMLASSMPGAVATPERAGWRLLGSIIETPSGPWFLKGVGPEKTMAAAREPFIEMCRSACVVGGGGVGPHGF